MVAFDGAPGVECPETLVEQLCVEAQPVALAQAICDLRRAQPQAEGLMLEIEDAHDAPVRLGLPGDRVAQHVVSAQALRQQPVVVRGQPVGALLGDARELQRGIDEGSGQLSCP
jgi:hypothetical protein